MKTEDDLWEKLWNYNLIRYMNSRAERIDIFNEQLENHTGRFLIFNMNYIRSLIFYQFILGVDQEEGFINYNYHTYCEMAIVNLVTSLEVYLNDVFRVISRQITISDIEMDKMVKFIKIFRVQDKYFNALSKYGDNNFLLAEIIPKRLDFQQKNRCKIAYRQLSIEIPGLIDKEQTLWDKIFGKRGYIAVRHRIIHEGISSTIDQFQDINIDFVDNVALDVANFVYNLDKKIANKYPKETYPDLYPKKVE